MREQGYAVSRGEVDAGVIGVAAARGRRVLAVRS
jgi:DNA-binding IclR family transcriptional regulator